MTHCVHRRLRIALRCLRCGNACRVARLPYEPDWAVETVVGWCAACEQPGDDRLTETHLDRDGHMLRPPHA